MCLVKTWFYNYKYVNPRKIYLEDDRTHNVEEVGDIAIMMHDGIIRHIRAVRYVSGLVRNLISLDTLEEEGYEFKSHVGTLKIVSSGYERSQRNGLYVLKGKALDSKEEALSLVCEDRLNLWHRRI